MLLLLLISRNIWTKILFSNRNCGLYNGAETQVVSFQTLVPCGGLFSTRYSVATQPILKTADTNLTGQRPGVMTFSEHVVCLNRCTGFIVTQEGRTERERETWICAWLVKVRWATHKSYDPVCYHKRKPDVWLPFIGATPCTLKESQLKKYSTCCYRGNPGC